ncbi:CobW family GTP-binding protein [Micropruina sp.]|uniref:CobW family GTP-binding protein n=1 Tax=Micropruina sp. TaxID=2737536 RepID=UPI0039E63E5D
MPVILVSGIAEHAMAAATIALQWDLPTAVVVQHEVDPEREVLTRTVSDITGLIEQVELNVDHACVSCAIRDDVVPTLERLAASSRWQVIVAQLPITADAVQVCRAVGMAGDAVRHLRIAATVVALDGESLVDDLLGQQHLLDRGLPVRPDDDAGVAETTTAMVEYADAAVLIGEPETAGREVLAVLARPDLRIYDDVGALDSGALLAGIHRADCSEQWVSVVRRDPLPHTTGERAWVLDFRSERPFHPDRLYDTIAVLGGGPRRSRGCFWLPSRPAQVCQWDGAGGLLGIGPCDRWDEQGPLTRIVVVGLDDGRDELEAAFRGCLLTDAELAVRGRYWEVLDDGFEPWLGPVRHLAIDEVQ